MIGNPARLALVAALLGPLLSASRAGDWPQWRYDAGRTAATPDELPPRLHLQWRRELPTPEPAWPDKSNRMLQFDASYEPVAMGKLLFVPSMVNDSVTAYDTETGDEKWRFYADGPVRFAPVVADGKVYFVSDDGRFYCLNAADGKLVRELRGAPGGRKVLGNGRLISAWPGRGGPVLAGGTIYFAAGIWPFMGTFIHAVNARTGRVLWTNSGSGSTWTMQQHSSPAFAGAAPQGYLAVAGKRLLVAGGRTVPAAYDPETGRFLYFHLASRQFGKSTGGYNVSAVGGHFFNGGAMFELADGRGVLQGAAQVYTAKAFYRADGKELLALNPEPVRFEYTDKKRKKRKGWELKALWKMPAGGLARVFIKAGSRLYGGAPDGTIAAVDVSARRIVWKDRVPGAVWNMLAADGKLFVVTRAGGLYCFGSGRYVSPAPGSKASRTSASAATVRPILAECDASKGYAIVLGASDRLVSGLLAETQCHVIVVDPDPGKIDSVRRARADYGRRSAAFVGDPATFRFPPYLANLVVTEDPSIDCNQAFVRRIFRTLRPYGGAFCFRAANAEQEAFRRLVASLKLPGAAVNIRNDGLTILRRKGPLPGSACWTHQYADAANTVVSADKLVRAPLGLLWFGGPTNEAVLPRHGHGPSPQVAGGRLFIEGPNMLRAVDVYTGRLIWEKRIAGIGKFHDNVDHQPGANEIGGNHVSLPDAVYVITPAACMRLDPATGGTVKTFAPPPGNPKPRWGHLAVSGEFLAATVSPVRVPLAKKGVAPPPGRPTHLARSAADPLKDVPGVAHNVDYAAAGKMLVVMDRHTGRILWTRRATYSFRHNAIAIGGGKLFCIDAVSPRKLAYLKRRGRRTAPQFALYALDLPSGKVVWRTRRNVFGTWLGYSAEHDALLQAGSAARDRAADEVGQGMVVHRGRDGSVLWENLSIKYSGPCLLHHERIITQGFALDLLTGRRTQRANPLTGRRADWSFKRMYGCNTVIGSEHLLAFRSAAAGFFDLRTDGGTGNLGGFKSGCTSNLIAADGVLSAPDYTRTCSCAYQNQTSLAFVHAPEAETWTFNALEVDQAPVRRVGLNFGAPGDRLADGTLWLDCPSEGSPSPDVHATLQPAKSVTRKGPKGKTARVSVFAGRCFRNHSSLVTAGPARWVAASGAEGLTEVSVPLAAGTYVLRLVFAEPDPDAKAGDRVFDVAVQGRTVLPDFDVVAAAGGPRCSVVKEFRHVRVTGVVRVALKPKTGRTILCGLELIAEAK